jgi:Cu(I)/Ag(I) efflux system membrane fusion protein
MNRVRLIALLAAVLAGGVALGYWLAHRGAPAPASALGTADSSASASESSPGRKVLYWHDPMVPNVKFDKPGKSPYMDMQLVPVYADDAPGGAAVRVSASVAQNLGIRLGKVERKELRPRLSAVGSVAFDDQLLELVQARVGGYIAKLRVKAPLTHVKRGQPLADILAPDWLAAQEEYLSLLTAQSARGQAIRDAARRRLVVLGVPESAIRHIETQHETQATTTVFAPIEGVVTELSVREGAAFMPGAALFRINGLGTVWVNAQVPEAQISQIPAGSTVTAHATAWPGVAFIGRVVALLPDVDAETRTLAVRITIENPERKLSPGMFVSLDFAGMPGQAQLVVPSEAVIPTGERSVVIVARDSGGFDVATVTTGIEADDMTSVLSGLSEGQSIVLSGQFLIDSEASLQSTVSRLETEPDGVAGDAGVASSAERGMPPEVKP